MASPIDFTIVAIIVREMVEMIFFLATHFGIIVKHETLTPTQKFHYYRTMIPCAILGVTIGMAFSIAVGFGVAAAIENSDSVEGGIEIGEAVSRLIAALFVGDFFMKIPKWFGLSNYKHRHIVLSPKPVVDIETPMKPNKEDEEEDTLPSRFELNLSLAWNLAREWAEAGSFVSLTVLFSQSSMKVLGASIGTALAVTALFTIIFTLGAWYVHAKGFCVVAVIMVGIIETGLVTGSTRAFEEVYMGQHNEESTAIIYDLGETPVGNVLSAFEFVGIADFFTALQMLAFVSTIVILTLLQYSHNYLGNPIVPYSCQYVLARINEKIGSAFGCRPCCK